MDPLATLARAYDNAEAVLRAVPADKWDAASPCAGWDARAVAAHLIGGAQMLATCAAGKPFDHASLEGDLLGDDPAGAFRAAADESLAAFRNDPSLFGKPITMPFGAMPGGMLVGIFTNDAFTHAWDLAKATGQNTDLDPEFAEGVLAAARQSITDDFRKPGFFDPATEAPAGASAADRLAAFLGRQV